MPPGFVRDLHWRARVVYLPRRSSRMLWRALRGHAFRASSEMSFRLVPRPARVVAQPFGLLTARCASSGPLDLFW